MRFSAFRHFNDNGISLKSLAPRKSFASLRLKQTSLPQFQAEWQLEGFSETKGTERFLPEFTLSLAEKVEMTTLCGPFDGAQDMLCAFAGDIPSF
jgi:hypothetical protein